MKEAILSCNDSVQTYDVVCYKKSKESFYTRIDNNIRFRLIKMVSLYIMMSMTIYFRLSLYI